MLSIPSAGAKRKLGQQVMPNFEKELLKHKGPSLLKDGLHFMAFGAQAIAQVGLN